MKIDIASLTYEEVAILIRRLQKMKMDAKFSRMGQAVMLQVEPQVLNQEDQLDTIPHLF